MAAMALAKVKYDTELFQFMRDTHGGPLFGEGTNHFYWAGRCDGVEAQVAGGEDHVPLLDFDLLKIHPQMVNHGMGYYERWFRHGYDIDWGRDTGSMEQIDKYRAQELAYGHAGFVGAGRNGQPPVGRPRASPHAPGATALRYGPAGGNPLRGGRPTGRRPAPRWPPATPRGSGSATTAA